MAKLLNPALEDETIEDSDAVSDTESSTATDGDDVNVVSDDDAATDAIDSEEEVPEFDGKLPDDNYQVDKLAELVEENDEKIQAEQAELEDINNRAEKAAELSRALEEFSQGRIFRKSNAAYLLAVNSEKVSLESFSFTEAGAAIRTVINDIIKKIVEAIKKAIQWVREKIRDATSLDRLTISSIRKSTDAFMLVRKQEINRLEKAFSNDKVDISNYVNLSNYKMWLAIDGVEVDNIKTTYRAEFLKLLAMLKTQNKFADTSTMKIAATLSKMVKTVEQGGTIEGVKHVFDPTLFVPVGSNEYSHYDDYTPPTNKKLLVCGPLLGGISLCNLFDRHELSTVELSELNAISSWELFFVNARVSLANDSMRLLGTEEVINANKVIDDISEELDKRRRTMQNYLHMVEQLDKVVNEVELAIRQENVDPQSLFIYSKILQACNALIKNAMTAIETSTLYIRKVLISWGLYLTLTTKKDQKVAEMKM